MGAVLASFLLLLMPPIADPAWFHRNSPQCVVHHASMLNLLPLIVLTENPECPWSSQDAAIMEIGRYLSLYSWWNFERSRNLELAASAIDGVMLLPGEEFSFNDTVGERTEETGFKKARVITDFGYVDGVGGGVCQTASTLHAAALLAGLEIEERHPHRFRVKYIPPGLDAAVDYGKKDLKIRNNTNYPVVFQLGRLAQGELLVRIMAPLKTWRVKYKYEIVKETPSSTVIFKEVEEPSDRVEYFGRPGLEIKKTVYRRNLITGHLEKLPLTNDEYLPSSWVLRVREYPEGKRVIDPASPAKIAALLEGSRYTIDSARFTDVDDQKDKYLPPVYLPRKKLRLFVRFSELVSPVREGKQVSLR